MNSVSWFIYIAGVADNLGVLLTITGIGFLLFYGMYCIIASAAAEEFTYLKPRFLALGIVPLLIACFLPSKNTMYAIAASQVGEKIVMSQQVQGITDDATKALHQWIKRQIDTDKPEKK